MRASLRLGGAVVVVALAASACGSDESGPNGETGDGPGGTSSGGGPGGPGDATSSGAVTPSPVPDKPAAVCTPPVTLVDTSTPTTVVGTGTPESCTDATFGAAVAKGGVITFDCGPDPATVELASEKVVPNDRETVIDGGGKVTLSGGGKTRLLALRDSYEKVTTKLVVQRITLAKGFTTAPPKTKLVDAGGAAIFHLGGTVVAIDARFEENRGPVDGQDVSGGAITGQGAGETIVVGSVLTGNRASNGGAIGALGTAVTVVNSAVVNNVATGVGGNPGDGGNGGGLAMDGKGRALTICGSTFGSNVAHAYGGGVFRTSYELEPTTITRSTFDGNAIPDGFDGLAGGLYLQGTRVTVDASTISNNAAKAYAALFVVEHGAASGALEMTNSTVADNKAWPKEPFTTTGLVGGIALGDRVTGTIKSSTIAGNSAQFASGISNVDRIRLESTIISNTALNAYVPVNCSGSAPANGDGNVQFPATNANDTDRRCATGVVFGDPRLAPLADNGGPTKTMMPAEGSIVFGAGRGCPAVDQRGRPRANPASCTAGAVE